MLIISDSCYFFYSYGGLLSFIMRQRLGSFGQFEYVGIVERNHVPVSSQNYHQFLVNQGSMPITSTWLLPQDLPFILVVDNFWQVEVILLIARLLSQRVKAKQQSFRSRWVCPSFLGLVIAAFNVAEQFFFPVEELSVFFFLNHRHFSLEFCHSRHVLCLGLTPHSKLSL